ncbi:hypothetical protein ALC53_13016 [Atta colombica]|uniref:Uncharacterized protein n=1 Tax=Atta colombica TaxID=520822 RepID=A0A195AWE9_9HYME|nr:hypothetical protein ALC53_13016 [Atta colombica]
MIHAVGEPAECSGVFTLISRAVRRAGMREKRKREKERKERRVNAGIPIHRARSETPQFHTSANRSCRSRRRERHQPIAWTNQSVRRDGARTNPNDIECRYCSAAPVCHAATFNLYKALNGEVLLLSFVTTFM